MFGNVADANLLAPLSLFLWIPITLLLFAFLRPATATMWSALLAWMFLPERVVFDPPVLPPFDKNAFAFVSSLLACLIFCPRRLWRARPRKGLDWFVLLMLAGAIGTAYTNGDTIKHGPTTLPPLTWYDGVSIVVRLIVDIVLPFYLGKALIREQRDLRNLLTILPAGALIYSLFILVEARLSPQFNVWIYGFRQHSFLQTLRAGGYRPMVFMSHGLAVALFVVTAVFAAIALARLRRPIFVVPATFVAPYLFVILLVCKSLGAIIYGIFLTPVVWWFSPRNQIRVAAILSLCVLIYPVLKVTGTFPSRALIELSQTISEERAQSLEFRFDNDDRLVQLGLQRPWFGWGGFSRGRVFNEWGRDISVTDGRWIILLNDTGALGLIAGFGLLVGPVFLALRRSRFIPDGEEAMMVAALCLIVTVDALDCLPNTINSSFEYFLPGALFGFLQAYSRARAKVARQPAKQPLAVVGASAS